MKSVTIWQNNEYDIVFFLCFIIHYLNRFKIKDWWKNIIIWLKHCKYIFSKLKNQDKGGYHNVSLRKVIIVRFIKFVSISSWICAIIINKRNLVRKRVFSRLWRNSSADNMFKSKQAICVIVFLHDCKIPHVFCFCRRVR